eukprot:4092346-Amphidinium_carterae.1
MECAAATLMKQLAELMKANGGKPAQWGVRAALRPEPRGNAVSTTLVSGRSALLASSPKLERRTHLAAGVPAKNPKPATNNMELTLKKQIAPAKEDPALEQILPTALAAVQSKKRYALPVKDEAAAPGANPHACGQDGPKNQTHARNRSGSGCFARRACHCLPALRWFAVLWRITCSSPPLTTSDMLLSTWHLVDSCPALAGICE